MRTLYLTIALIFTLCIAVVTTLYLMQPAPVKNGFKRGKIYKPEKQKELKLLYDYWYITWRGENNIYFGNYVSKLNLFSCNYNLQDTIYQKLSFKDGSRLKLESLEKDVLRKIEPNGDGFNTDGFLCLDETTGCMVYTYYYRNSFVYLDKGFNVLLKARLIDTNSVAKIEIGSYQSNGKTIRTLVKPGLMVNKRGFVDSKWLYNHSDLAGDNESINTFNAHEVIDVYRLADGKYSHSIYLWKHPKQKLTDFVVRNNLLIALYEKYLVTYKLPLLKGE